MEQLKLTLSKRFDVSKQALDLQRLRLDPDLVCYDIDIFVNRRSCMAATLQVIEKNFPELRLYYLIHDCGNRQHLLGAYHEEACFTLTIPFHSEDAAISSLCKYFKDSRNIKKLKDPHECVMGRLGGKDLRVQLLKHTKRFIVHTLCVLPKTQHDFSSFVVDLWFQTMMLCFSVNRVFKESRGSSHTLTGDRHVSMYSTCSCKGYCGLFVVEVEGSSQGCVRAFTRIFIATPASYASLCIVNDELFVRNASPSETQECLQDNEWNYTRAGQVCSMLKTEGKIPEEAFKEIP
ncbi:hypothetical protein EI555_010176 [Monodon monoceros]|uniref:Uncharacterized protein n=1 Tax=Monodon monoceros TaxID=40151 RepID=A0A4U1EDC6_MONMO|nr:hypothetical protein EI555_010176 [Monodon monoceros]